MIAYTKSNTPPGQGDKRAIPWHDFARIQDETGVIFIRDVCAEAHTTKVIGSYWTKKDDALSIDWASTNGLGFEIDCFFLRSIRPEALWMNPPYSDPGPWCKKAYRQSQKGLIIVGCLPDDRSAMWYQNWIEDKAPLVYVPNKRVSFDGQNGNPKGSIFVLWMPMQVNKTSYIRFKI